MSEIQVQDGESAYNHDGEDAAPVSKTRQRLSDVFTIVRDSVE